MLHGLFFYLFAGLTILTALLVVANPFTRNPVTSAMFLVLSIVSLAGLFVLLHAYFLAAVQVLVYAGAVIVLFLFVIMLLDLREEAGRRLRPLWIILGLATAGLLFTILVSIVTGHAWHGAPPVVQAGGTFALGLVLFREYLLPFEIVSVLLLSAMVGVIILSKKNLK